jgi:hypothetical protein
VIKAEAVYCKQEHFYQVPKRCENHKISKQFDNNNGKYIRLNIINIKFILKRVNISKTKYQKMLCTI